MSDRAVEDTQVPEQAYDNDKEVVNSEEQFSGQSQGQNWRWHGGLVLDPAAASNHLYTGNVRLENIVY